MSSIKLKGSSSGDVTITVPAAAGTNTVTIPAVTGNVITNKTAGTIIQVVNVQTTAVATGTTIFPADDTIPQKTEGDEYMTLAITPTNASNKLRIFSTFYCSHSAASSVMSAGLFQDDTAATLNAIMGGRSSGAGRPATMVLDHYMTAGTTSATTFKIRAGGPASGTTTFNGLGTNRFFGGLGTASITITEIAV